MKIVQANAKYSTALVMVVAMCFAFMIANVSAVHAEEDVAEVVTEEVTDDESDEVGDTDESEVDDVELKKRAAMMEQIKSLREIIAQRKKEQMSDMKEKREEMKEERKEMKAGFKLDRVEFMASLEGLGEEEKRAAMLKFIAEIKAEIELRKAAFAEKKAEIKTDFKEMKEEQKEKKAEFKTSLDGLSKEDKIAAIMAQVEVIKKQIEDRKKVSSDVDEGEDESDEDDEDEESDEDEDEDDEDSDEDQA